MDTSAMPVGRRAGVPLKMTSSILPPRKLLADCSPSTQFSASAMLDLPQPLGPTMAAMPSPASCTSVRSENDLKPKIWSLRRRSMDAPQAMKTGRYQELYARRNGGSTTTAQHIVDKQYRPQHDGDYQFNSSIFALTNFV